MIFIMPLIITPAILPEKHHQNITDPPQCLTVETMQLPPIRSKSVCLTNTLLSKSLNLVVTVPNTFFLIF